jgi:penicillin amidase
VVGDDYPHFLGYDHCPGDRAQRIAELVDGKPKVDVDHCQRMQFDQVSPMARAVAAVLAKVPVDDPELRDAVKLMAGWDGEMAAGSPAAAIYEVFVRRLTRLLTADRLGDAAVCYAGKGPTPVLQDRSIFGHRSREWLQSVLTDPDCRWFGFGCGPTRDDCVRSALRETVDYLKAELGPEVDDWAWGKLHQLTYAHVLGQVPALGKVFNLGPYPLGGNDDTLWATGTNLHDLAGGAVIGPAYRMIVDLGDLGNSLGLLAPGQSGRLGSKHYGDQVEAWFTGDYHPMVYAREDVEQHAEARLVLEPG